MMEDNFYKASTERLIAPSRRYQEKLQREKIAFERERPVVAAVVEHLEKIIADCEKIDSIKNLDNPETFMREVIVNKRVCAILRHELSAIKTKIKKFDKNPTMPP